MDVEQELLADLEKIDAERQRLKEKLQMMMHKQSPAKVTKSSMVSDLSCTDAGAQRPQDDTMAELNRRYLHGSPSYELYGPDEKDARPKVRANDLCEDMSTLRFTEGDKEFYQRTSTPGVHFSSPETRSTSTPTSVTWSLAKDSYTMPSIPRAWGPNVTPMKNEMIDNQQFGKTVMKPATFDGTSSWIDYRAHFEACGNINMWNDKQKGLYLAASLRGQAQTVLGNMRQDNACAYRNLCEALEARFAPANQTELYRAMLREKRQKSTETLPELGESIRRLTHLAYPSAPCEVTEMIAKDQFVDALTDFDMRLRIQQSRPKSLNEAIRLAVEIEAFCRAERQRRDISYARGASGEKQDTQETNVRGEFKELRDELRASLRKLELKIAALTDSKSNTTTTNMMNTDGSQSKGSFPYKCHNCGTRGHRARDCFAQKRAGCGQCMSQRQKRTSSQSEDETENTLKQHSPIPGSSFLTQTRIDVQSGLFVKVTVNGILCNFLVDTGASLTILSHSVYENITKPEEDELTPVTQSIILADGALLQTKGKCDFLISIGNSEFEVTTVVADISADGILGLDFLKQNKCLVDVASAKMYVEGTEHELQLKGHLGCFNVSLKETVCPPPSSEMICSDSWSLPSTEQKRDYLVMCPPEDLQKRRFACSQCDKAFVKSSLLVRHQKRVHCSKDTVNPLETSSSFMNAVITESDDDRKWPEDPDQLIYEPDLESGRTIRKKTSPSLPGVKRKAPEQTPDKETPTSSSVSAETTGHQEAPLIPFNCLCCKTQTTTNDASTQPDGSSHQRTVRVIRRYQKDGESVERFEEDIWNA